MTLSTPANCTHRDALPAFTGPWCKTVRYVRPGAILLLVFCSALAAAPVRAATSENDVTIAARALGFLDKPLRGAVRVGIVYAADNPQSTGSAGALRKIMESGLKVGGLSLIPVLVPIDGVGVADVNLLFLAEGVGARASKVGDAGRTKHIACVTLDIDQVRNGNCTIGVKSEPRVEILVNREAAAGSGVVFAGAFKMLITEF
jgi:hypothetical protein